MNELTKSDKLWIWWQDNKGISIVIAGYYILLGFILWTFQVNVLLWWLVKLIAFLFFGVWPFVWIVMSMGLAVLDLTKSWR